MLFTFPHNAVGFLVMFSHKRREKDLPTRECCPTWKLKEQWRANTRADLCIVTRQQETRDRLRDINWMVYWLCNGLLAWKQFNGLLTLLWFIGVVTRESRCLITTSLSKIAKRKHVALSKVKMDCLCRKLSPFFCQFLSAIGESEKDCRHIFEQCRLSPKPLGRPQTRKANLSSTSFWCLTICFWGLLLALFILKHCTDFIQVALTNFGK